MLVDHLATGACPAGDRHTIDMRLNAEGNEGVARLVRLPIGNIAFLENGLPVTVRKVVLINELAAWTAEDKIFGALRSGLLLDGFQNFLNLFRQWEVSFRLGFQAVLEN